MSRIFKDGFELQHPVDRPKAKASGRPASKRAAIGPAAQAVVDAPSVMSIVTSADNAERSTDLSGDSILPVLPWPSHGLV
ncbi:MAG TPA: hypothetical protein VHV77_02440 [Pirellulales bacterium]|nr:hypothetical protein [Pirellulales bacterium]